MDESPEVLRQRSSDGYDFVNLPFEEPPGKQVARGWSESKVFEHGDDWVLKVTYRGKRNSENQLRENKADYELFKERLGDYVPETQFLIAQDKKGKRINVSRQRRIKGRNLLNMSDEEIVNDPVVRGQVVGLFKKIVGMWDEIGRIPDLIGPKGGGGKRVGGFTFGFHAEHTPNIIVEDKTKKVYLVDISAPERFNSKSARKLYRWICERVVKNMREFIDKYGDAALET